MAKHIKPLLLAIDHYDAHDPKQIDLSEYFANGKTLFIEGRKQDMELDRFLQHGGQLTTNYIKIIEDAEAKGMTVAYLDGGKIDEVARKIFRKWKIPAIDRGDPEAISKVMYANKILRERKWVILLRKAKPGDVMVMHSVHAYRIAPKLGIPRSKVRWIDRPTSNELQYNRQALSWQKLRKMREMRNQERQKRRSQRKIVKPK